MQENELTGPDPYNCCKSWSPYGLCWKCSRVHKETNGIILLLYSLPAPPPCIFYFTSSIYMWLMLPAHGREFGTKWSLRCLPTQTILWFHKIFACLFFPQWCCWRSRSSSAGYRRSLLPSFSVCCPSLPIPPASLLCGADGANSHGGSWYSWSLFPDASTVPWKLPVVFLENTQLIIVFCLWFLASY